MSINLEKRHLGPIPRWMRVRIRRNLALGLLLLVVTSVVMKSWGNGVTAASTSSPTTVIYYVATDGDDANDGSMAHPWATINHAATMLEAGETVYIRGGSYQPTQPVQPRHSGSEGNSGPNHLPQYITYAAFPGEHVILDARSINVPSPTGDPPFAHDQGAFQIENVEYIRVKNLEVVNSHNAGFTVRNSRHIQLYNNRTSNTFSSGIAVWDGDHQQVIGNTVVNANLPQLAAFERPDRPTPHEAISVGGASDFEVAYNEVAYSQKEGIDIKNTSHHGTVHHNLVHHVVRQGLYVDSWFGILADIELFENVVHDCSGNGLAIGAENGEVVRNIRAHHNVLYDNWGAGIFFARWGKNHPRQHIEIDNNTVYHNGYGPPNLGEEFYWTTGGLYLFTIQLEDVDIHHNIFSHNTGIQVGYSDRYLENATDINTTLQQRNIRIYDNVIDGDNNSETPIYAGWPSDNYAYIYGIDGEGAIAISPQFVDAFRGNFYLKEAISELSDTVTTATELTQPVVGALPNIREEELSSQPWWDKPFPPNFEFREEEITVK